MFALRVQGIRKFWSHLTFALTCRYIYLAGKMSLAAQTHRMLRRPRPSVYFLPLPSHASFVDPNSKIKRHSPSIHPSTQILERSMRNSVKEEGLTLLYAI